MNANMHILAVFLGRMYRQLFSSAFTSNSVPFHLGSISRTSLQRLILVRRKVMLCFGFQMIGLGLSYTK